MTQPTNMGIKRCPSFSKRPGFPCGLRVLLVDADNAARSKAENLLKECSYTVSSSCKGILLPCLYCSQQHRLYTSTEQ